MSLARLALGAAAAAMAGLALGLRDSAVAAEEAHPAPGRFMQLGPARLHFLDRGTGKPPVVLLHGMGSQVEDWATSGVIDLLCPDHRVVAFDRPGFGHSPRPRGRDWTASAQAALFAEAIGRLGLDRPVVVGHSWGAFVATALAMEHPEAVRGVVLAGGCHFQPPAWLALAMPPGVPVVGDALRYTAVPPLGRALAPRVIRRLFAPQPVPAAFLEGFPVSMALRPWHLRASGEEAMRLPAEIAALSPRYGAIRVPVAILAGADDQLVDTEANSVRLHGTIPGSTLTLIPGAGHMVHHAAPEVLVARIAELA
ncbi:MAG TPA: alpha/beta hydrolase [Acetobacteraceae bacterium]|nr:alpha/beta hydrolase [Acetobacteraceae bacterium]